MPCLRKITAIALWLISCAGGLTMLVLYWSVLNIWWGKAAATLLTLFVPFGALGLPFVLPTGSIEWTGFDALLVMAITFVCSKIAHRL